jgi:hypothetical protein
MEVRHLGCPVSIPTRQAHPGPGHQLTVLLAAIQVLWIAASSISLNND